MTRRFRTTCARVLFNHEEINKRAKYNTLHLHLWCWYLLYIHDGGIYKTNTLRSTYTVIHRNTLHVIYFGALMVPFCIINVKYHTSVLSEKKKSNLVLFWGILIVVVFLFIFLPPDVCEYKYERMSQHQMFGIQYQGFSMIPNTIQYGISKTISTSR